MMEYVCECPGSLVGGWLTLEETCTALWELPLDLPSAGPSFALRCATLVGLYFSSKTLGLNELQHFLLNTLTTKVFSVCGELCLSMCFAKTQLWEQRPIRFFSSPITTYHNFSKMSRRDHANGGVKPLVTCRVH